jgi:hypothetical protein
VTLILWGIIEQNVVIIAASIPTLRPFFHKAFLGRGDSKDTGNSHSRLSSKPPSKTYWGPSGHKRTADSGSDVPLDEHIGGKYAELNESRAVDPQTGIWRTVDVNMEWDEEADAKHIKNVVPAPLRETKAREHV